MLYIIKLTCVLYYYKKVEQLGRNKNKLTMLMRLVKCKRNELYKYIIF